MMSVENVAISTLQLWAKLQEIAIKKRETNEWLNFYKERLFAEQRKLVTCQKQEKTLMAALHESASAEELAELKAWSLP